MRYAHMVRGVMKLATAGLVVAVFLSPASLFAAPETCCGPCADPIGPHYSTPEDMPKLADRAQVLFVGTVVKAELVPCCDRFADLTFRIRKAWKGAGRTSVTVRMGAGCADLYPFVIGREYLVAASSTGATNDPLLPDGSFFPLEASKAGELMKALDAWRRAGSDEKPK